MRSWILAILFLAVVLVFPGAEIPEGAASVPMRIKRILVIDQSPAVLLVDESQQNYLLMFIDFFMANAIRMGMEAPALSRPLTHDLIGIFLRQLGAKVTRISITELKNNTYYALITIEVNGRLRDIDARPSDALAIAVRLKSPIFAAPALLKSMTAPEGEAGPGDPKRPAREPPRKRAST